MKKSLIALAALAASSLAMAQSSVTMFGIVDVNLGYTNHNGANGSVYGMGHSGNSTSRLGFRGVEDLGGGLKAGFWLEGAINNDVGGGAGAATGFDFKRESTVRLSGGFGEVRLGRELTPTYRNVSGYDVFGQVGMGRNEALVRNWSGSGTDDASAVRQNNMVSYYSPNMGGFSFSGGYGMHEKTTGSEGRYLGVAGKFANGPFSVGLGYENRKLDGLGANKQNKLTLGGSYDLGSVKLVGLVVQNKYKLVGLADRKLNSYALGVSAPVGAGTIKAQYALYDQKWIAGGSKAHHLSLGYQYDLSKRTALYTTASYIKNKDGSNIGLNGNGIGNAVPGAGINQTGIQAGIRHSF